MALPKRCLALCARAWPSIVLALCLSFFSGCFRVSGLIGYKGPQPRPAALEDYYSKGRSYGSFRQEYQRETDDYTLRKIVVQSDAGAFTIDYFAAKVPSDDLVFVFPVLGGKNIIENHFAEYFAQRGIDAAIVNRNNEFKDPARFDELEELFRKNVVRDRIAIDFFEQEFAKKDFATFGISRGGINVAMTAGVDPRLKHNIIVLGGTNVIDIFRHSDQKRIAKYIKAVREQRGISEEEFFQLLQRRIFTDPKYTARYLDARNTLLILAIFDKTVPFNYGMLLRDQIGSPPTIFLFANHYTGLLFTQTASFIPPRLGPGLFPFPYVEQEAVSFFKNAFDTGRNWRMIPYKVAQFPMNLAAETISFVGAGIESLFSSESKSEDPSGERYWAAVVDQWHKERAKAEQSVVAEGTASLR